jgi:hypothetical protein
MGEAIGGVVIGLAFSLMFGVGAMFYGRWVFENPTKAAPDWLFRNPSNPTVMACFRVYGVLFIFVGSVITFGGFLKLMLPEFIAGNRLDILYECRVCSCNV